MVRYSSGNETTAASTQDKMNLVSALVCDGDAGESFELGTSPLVYYYVSVVARRNDELQSSNQAIKQSKGYKGMNDEHTRISCHRFCNNRLPSR